MFAEEAGLHINRNKTKAFFSKNTPKQKIRVTCNDLNIKAGHKGEKYLGLPLIIQRITTETFYDIINKTQMKITNWYNNLLSYSGRTTLLNHVLSTMPNYTMNTHKIPAITLNKINSINKKFLWNASTESNKKGPLNWDKICTPKNYGGLGIKNIKILNQAYILKLGWRLKIDHNSLWSRTIRGKYFHNKSFEEANMPKNHHSVYWKNPGKTKQDIETNTFWIVGNGSLIQFWKDKWLGNFIIQEYVSNIPEDLQNITVSKLIDWKEKEWKLDSIRSLCPEFIINKIMAIPIPQYEREDEFR